jgi:uncharacterized membrane protein YqjE
MNDPSGNPGPSFQDGEQPSDWREALMGLISSRVALLQLEGQEAARNASRKAMLGGVAAVALLFAWGLLLAGGIAAIAAASGWQWYWVAMGFAGVHLIVGLSFLRAAKAANVPSFPVSRAEFIKDREWIQTLRPPGKSND